MDLGADKAEKGDGDVAKKTFEFGGEDSHGGNCCAADGEPRWSKLKSPRVEVGAIENAEVGKRRGQPSSGAVVAVRKKEEKRGSHGGTETTAFLEEVQKRFGRCERCVAVR